MSNLYIEISPRGAGKTYRLVEDVVKYLCEHLLEDVYIVSPSLRGSRFIRDNKKIPFHLTHRIHCVEANSLRLSGLNGKRVYYDDFLYIDCLGSVNPNGYYCSSARAHKFDKSYRSTFLAELLKVNNYKYVSFTIPADNEYVYDMFTGHERSEALNTEYFNHLFV